jgi:plastocyanin
MKKRSIVAPAIAAVALAMLPAHANDPVQDFTNIPNRYPPQPAGTEQHLRLVFGPYTISPGVDRNQVTVDVPFNTGFSRSVFPNLIDVETGEEFTEQEAHIHHAHWFRISTDDQYEYYSSGLSWVFGTGEERTGGSLADRESAEEGWRYGIFVDGKTPQTLIFMIHNKTPRAITGYITLDVDFIYGTAAAIQAADPQHRPMHALRGVLTGTTRDAVAAPVDDNSKFGVLMKDYTSDFSGTLVGSASHMHPGGKQVYVVNLGPKGSGAGGFLCGLADLDGDGVPGTTLFVSRKFDHVPAVWPYTEDYQMGGTQFGYRAPIHYSDVIRQYGVYDVDRTQTGIGSLPTGLFEKDSNGNPILGTLDGRSHAWYEAMSYTGMYSDTQNSPVPASVTSASQCTAQTFAPRLITANAPNVATNPADLSPIVTNNPRDTMITHAWGHDDFVCGVPDPFRNDETYPCDKPDSWSSRPRMGVVDSIHVANFVYSPGDLHSAVFGQIPQVRKGSTVRFVNEDVGIGVRHTFTSCAFPCNGDYVANYPMPDGRFDTGKLGNLDYVDGGLFQDDDTLPTKTLTIDLDPGLYTFYCSIHPWMRGALEVVI